MRHMEMSWLFFVELMILLVKFEQAESQVSVPGQLAVTVSSRSTTSVTIFWSAPSGSVVDSYEVIVRSDTSGECSTMQEGSGTFSGDSTSYSITISELEEDSSFIFTVRAINSAGSSENTITAMTLEAAPSAAPTSVRVSEVTSFSITVQWGAVACIDRNGNITGYSVRYGVQGSAVGNKTVGHSVAEATISGLTPSTEYTLEVAAVNSAGIGVYSNPRHQLTLVNAPSVIVLPPVTSTTIRLSWSGADSVVNSYEVMWTARGCPGVTGGSVTVDGGTTSYTMVGLEEYITYTITVTATNAVGSAVSDKAIATQRTREAAPSGPPTSVSTTSTSTTITVQWGAVDCIHRNGEITDYSVRYGVHGSAVRVKMVSGGDARQITLYGLTPSTEYTIEVAAVNNAGIGVYSNPKVQLMPVKAPSITVIPSSVTSTTIPLSWTSAGSVVNSYDVMWTARGCPHVRGGSATVYVGTSYIIVGLEEYITYTITVTATNALGSAVSDQATQRTREAAPSASPSIRTTITSTTITVQWGAVDCIHRNGHITHYLVRYGVQGSAEGGRIEVTGTQTTISELTPSTIYTIDVTAVNNAGSGPTTLLYQQTLVEAPSVAVLSSLTSTTIPLSWSSAGSVVNSYEVMWTARDCPGVIGGSDTVDGGTTSYTMVGLEEYISYTITVTATNAVGSAVSDQATQRTREAAPSGPPTSVSTTSTSTTITVQWGAVDCIHRNGDITGYSVRYGVQGSGSTQIVNVSGGSVTEATISGLMSFTAYSIEVAAINSAGTGVYSDVRVVQTENVYLSLNDDIIPNHGYVMVSDIGSTDDTALICHTNRPAFDNNGQSNSGGEWFGPDGTAVGTRYSNEHAVPGFRRNRGPGIVRLIRYTTNMNPSLNGMTFTPLGGIYHCEVQDATLVEQRVYAGLYNSEGGNILMPGGVTLTVDSDLKGASPQFTLICISTGGPATTVTWTRDSVTAVGHKTTLLANAETAQYTHTLTVTGRLGGLHTCTVSNDKPSSSSSTYIVRVASAPTNLMAVQTHLTSVELTWSPPTPLGDTTGYRIYYSGGSSGSVNVSGDSTDNYLLTGLQNGDSYSISLMATSQHFFSDALIQEVTLIPAPDQPSVSVTSITATSISLSWTSAGSEVTSSEVMWRVFRGDDGSGGGSTTETDEDDEGSGSSGSITSTSYTVQDLKSSTNYSLTVTVTNVAGSTISKPIIIATATDSSKSAAIGGVIAAVVIIITTGVIVIVIVVLVFRRFYSHKTRKKGPVNAKNTLASTVETRELEPRYDTSRGPVNAWNMLASTVEPHELSKFPEEAVYEEPEIIHASRKKTYQIQIRRTNMAVTTPSVPPSTPRYHSSTETQEKGPVNARNTLASTVETCELSKFQEEPRYENTAYRPGAKRTDTVATTPPVPPRYHHSTKTQKKGPVNAKKIPVSTVETHKLSTFLEQPLYDEPEIIRTSQNEAYRLVTLQTGQ